MIRRLCQVVSTAAALVVCAQGARAQSPVTPPPLATTPAASPAAPVVTATATRARDALAGEMLFREGRRLLKAGDVAGACRKFEESDRLDPAPGTLANLADCEERLGHVALAWEHWREVADKVPADDPRRASALARAAELEKKIARLVLEPARDAPANLVVKRDGITLVAASLGVALPVDPGPHTIVVSAPGREPRRFDIELAQGERRRLAINAGEALLAPVATGGTAVPGELALAARPPAVVSRRRGTGITFIALGAAGLGAGAFFVTRALQARADARAACAPESNGQPPLCWKRAEPALNRDTTFSRLADGSFVVGGLLVAAGGYLLFSGEAGEAGARAASPAPLRFGASPLPQGAEVQVAGSF